ncbi:hypothetical protein M378DRAFT_12904 [Amanita muscaria Koide BX008]|uniref:Uncharacterized protein n=1 Tax=Amanita muscaria (strain Koide BX008) TaxID=946122 RepID=A0A0C2SGR5_AMAMK|nr:hypothetical protein M378DRAFT_12904 [Amanita muscaria Koide BX008]
MLMIESLASHGMIDKLNDEFKRTLTDRANDGIAPTFNYHKLKFLVDKLMHVNNDIGERFAMVQAVWEERQDAIISAFPALSTAKELVVAFSARLSFYRFLQAEPVK